MPSSTCPVPNLNGTSDGQLRLNRAERAAFEPPRLKKHPPPPSLPSLTLLAPTSSSSLSVLWTIHGMPDTLCINYPRLPGVSSAWSAGVPSFRDAVTSGFFCFFSHHLQAVSQQLKKKKEKNPLSLPLLHQAFVTRSLPSLLPTPPSLPVHLLYIRRVTSTFFSHTVGGFRYLNKPSLFSGRILFTYVSAYADRAPLGLTDVAIIRGD